MSPVPLGRSFFWPWVCSAQKSQKGAAKTNLRFGDLAIPTVGAAPAPLGPFQGRGEVKGPRGAPTPGTLDNHTSITHQPQVIGVWGCRSLWPVLC